MGRLLSLVAAVVVGAVLLIGRVGDDGVRGVRGGLDNVDDLPAPSVIDDVPVPAPGAEQAAATNIEQEVNSATEAAIDAACLGWSQASAQADLEPYASYEEQEAAAIQAAYEDLTTAGQGTAANYAKVQAIVKAFAEYDETEDDPIDLAITQACNSL